MREEIFKAAFNQVKCKNCQEFFDLQGIEILHEGKNFRLCKINCLACKQVAGVAIVRFHTVEQIEKEKIKEENQKEERQHTLNKLDYLFSLQAEGYPQEEE